MHTWKERSQLAIGPARVNISKISETSQRSRQQNSTITRKKTTGGHNEDGNARMKARCGTQQSGTRGEHMDCIYTQGGTRRQRWNTSGRGTTIKIGQKTTERGRENWDETEEGKHLETQNHDGNYVINPLILDAPCT